MKRRSFLAVAMSMVLVVALGGIGLTGCTSSSGNQASSQASNQAAQPATQTITDMVGRTVEVPSEVKSIATFGSVGVLNAFVECMGKGDLICNEMPENFTKNDKWAMQYRFAPQIKGAPVLETADGVNVEQTLKLAPDLCLTMTKETAEQLEQNGLTAVVLTWNDVEDVKTAVTLMGQILGSQDVAKDYISYFDGMVAKADQRTASLPEGQRKSVIYGDVETLTNPHIISEWWIDAAGGISVTAATHKKNSLEYTMEELLAWQPQVIFSSNTKLSDIYADTNLANLPAIQDKQVFVVPTVAHVWGNRTVEQPLTVLWAMNKMYPELYTEAELAQDIKYFYSHFFKCDLTDAEVANIITAPSK